MSEKKLKEVNCDSIMIGHTHTPEIQLGSYYNTGDFCESCSYIIESIEGQIELRYIR